MRHRSVSWVMRHIVPLVLLTALVWAPEEIEGQDRSAGVRIGASVADFHGDDSGGLDGRRAGVAAGGLLVVPMAGWFGLQTELSWLRKGGKGTMQGFEEPLAVSLTIDYLQVPLLARLTLPALGRLHPLLLTGPAVSFELDCDVHTPPSELAVTLGCESSAPDDVRRTVDWGWIFGGAFVYGSGGRTFFLDARADVGLVTLNRPPGDLDLKNRAYVVTVGVLLGG